VQLAFSRLPPEALRAHQFTGEFETIYEQTFASLIRDSAVMPGMGTMDDIVAEREAFCFTWLKERDARGPRARWAPHDYDRMNQTLLKAIALRVQTAKALDVDEATQRHYSRAAAATVTQIIEALPGITPAQRAEAHRMAPAIFAANL
jgi:hypothetical protein